MRAAVMYSPGDIRLEDIAKPELKPGHVMLRVAAVGVCGSDIPRMLIKGAHKVPIVCGHEFSGHITEVGEGVEGYEVGELMGVPPMLPCYKCDQCMTGNFSRCRDYDYFGSRRDGAYTEFVAVPVGNLLRAPEGMDPRATAMIDPASIALHAIWKAPPTAGQRGAVIGCGPIGLFAIQWMKLMGCTEVIAIDISEEKLAQAREAGADRTFLVTDQIPANLKCDIIVEAAGHNSSINVAAKLAAPGGHVVFIGIPVGDITLENKTFQHFLRQEVSLRGAWNSFGAPYPGKQWTVTLDSLASGRLKWEFMITHELGLEALPGMFEKIKNKSEFFSKIMFRP
ncbi:MULTISPECIES: galactitol-1-phosphate 5-dehydrogenase [Rhizobium]|uniref:Galactitol-1-phosphate 5-dehydrogenase n=1 Tax=Rhizobium changzhiense TaxID=2692317 RepID=A0A7Z0UHW1_9HYPH|nr:MULTISPECIES: galactitol-1-phosphate 5-dehydrogenase [Rhizobium]MBA5800500.1 galactitol-1-phosphate 5-dehydrogenase [Rhizobium changzhiense]MCH4547367.1 galactitol-1-phosphate 5-dehydrogenase [Rhizobium changzhiense]MCW0019122.1 galactitol-1-phosphate 5-dehydrogenase [Rhizobium sp. BT-226]NNU48912.1 galactitol-1-phosphate 5-dehydrogenase [Rhizobium changzhiense]NZD66012.1 galactitol-1-phosphate 5-dehydrogenase [Rhizobium changzhiense]